MKERPILFSAPMVRAVLADTKTQTRRALRVQPPTGTEWMNTYHHPKDTERPYWWAGAGGDLLDFSTPCPYGQPGDRLWCRETWLTVNGDDTFYRADYLHDPAGDRAHGVAWKPSIHMHRSRSRITLEVTGVRVERLQDISEADALAEGIVQLRDGGFGLPAGEHYHAADPRISYWSLWEHINGTGSVEANPWVWCVAFRHLEAA